MQVNQGEHPAHGSYRYKIFGLGIASDIMLPQLLSVTDIYGEPDVTICTGEVPRAIDGVVEKCDTYQLAKNEYILQIPEVGGYYVSNGSRIIVKPDKRVEKHLFCEYLLSLAIGVLLLQREVISMHGSAVVVDGYGVIFTGVRGAGKSTLAAAFRERGYSMLTDDVAALTFDDDGVGWVQPACPRQSLQRDSAEAVGMVVTPEAGVGIESRDNEEKFVLTVDKGFCQAPVPLGAVYELQTGKLSDVVINRLAGTEKLEALMKNSWARFIDRLGLQKAHFEQCLNVARKIPVSRLTKSQGLFFLGDQVRMVEADLRGGGCNGSSNLAR